MATGQATASRWPDRPVRLEILVQDDASPDVNFTELIGPPVRTERNAANLGFAGTCNAGAARAAGDVLLFLNHDTVARDGWIEPLLDLFAAQPQVGVVGPKLLFGPNPHGQTDESIQSCGGLFDRSKSPFHRFLGWAADDWRVNQRERVSWTTGAALAVRRLAFERVGGFDPGYQRGYFEDVDLCLAVQMLGYECWYEPAAVFEHSVGSTGGVPAEVFRANALRFHRRWDDRIKPDVDVVVTGY